MDKKRLGIIGLVLAVALVPVLVADVMYFYQGTINVVSTSQPLIFGYGPNGNPSGQYGSYVSVTNGTAGVGFTATISLTNSSYAFYSQVVQIQVKTSGYMYISNESLTGSSINNAYILIQAKGQTGFPDVIQVVSDGAPVFKSSGNGGTSGGVSLTEGTYYVSILVQPSLPLPNDAPGTSLGELSLYFGFNPFQQTSYAPLPPT